MQVTLWLRLDECQLGKARLTGEEERALHPHHRTLCPAPAPTQGFPPGLQSSGQARNHQRPEKHLSSHRSTTPPPVEEGWQAKGIQHLPSKYLVLSVFVCFNCLACLARISSYCISWDNLMVSFGTKSRRILTNVSIQGRVDCT